MQPTFVIAGLLTFASLQVACSSAADPPPNRGSGGGSLIGGQGGSRAGSGGANEGGSGGANEGGGSSGAANNGQCNGTLTGVVRDFRADFPDMEVTSHVASKCYCDDRGIVKPTLGADRKPIYDGDATQGTASTTGTANFDRWFRDAADVNRSEQLPLVFTDPDGDGVFTHDNQEFFPVDGKLFGNEKKAHNYHFTFELHTSFVYKGRERFTFIGDDDVFVFINNHQVIDLGGIHSAQTGIVDLKAQASELGLTEGETYTLDFFFAERHVTQSHFRLETSIDFIDCGSIIN